ncbi:hypothetical protein D3C75_1030390 [compost metagenome]
MCILYEYIIVTHTEGTAAGCIETELGLHSADDQIGDPQALKFLMQPGPVKRIPGRFLHDCLSFLRLYKAADLPGRQSLGILLVFSMLNIHNRNVCGSRFIEQRYNPLHHIVHIIELHFRIRKHRLLNIDNQQCG